MPQGEQGARNQVALSVVLPAHNEVELLGSTVTALLTGLEERRIEHEILVVENGSSDGTLRLARLLSAQLDRLRVLSLPTGDYGAALAAGLGAARGRVVACFDVDYYDLAFLDSALGVLGRKEADLVLASKRAPGASDRRPLLRRLLTAGFATTLHLALGLEVSDAHGMKVLAAPAVAPLLGACSMRGSLFDVELVLRASRAGLVVAEVPAVVAERRAPRTSVARRTLESLAGVARLRLRLELERRRPAHLRRP